MNRTEFFRELMDVTMAQAMVFESMVKDIPDSKLVDFGRFIVERYEPKKAKMLVIKEAIADFRRMTTERSLQKGAARFQSMDEMVRYIKAHYRGKEIVSGPAGYHDFVVIGMDKDGRLVNHYALDEYGRPKRLGGDDEMEVYAWLYANQHTIGVVRYVLPQTVSHGYGIGNENLTDKRISQKITKLIGGTYARVDKSRA